MRIIGPNDVPRPDMIQRMTPGRGRRAALASISLAVVLATGSALAAGRGVAVVYKAPPGGKGGLSGNVTIYEHSLAEIGRAHV